MSYFAHPTAVIDEGCTIGSDTQIWCFTHLRTGCIIGDNCILGQNVFIDNNVIIGNGVKVQNNVSVYAGVVCEDEVFLGPSVVFTNVINPRSAISRKHEIRETVIGKGATVGANATVICGNEIGAHAFIGAGTVVTRPVPDYALVTGNPARQTGWISAYGHKLYFDETGFAVCSRSGERYRLSDGQVTRIS